MFTLTSIGIVGICALFFTLVVVVCHVSVIAYHTAKTQKAKKKNKGQDLEQRITADIVNTLKEAGVIAKDVSNDLTVKKVAL